MIVVRTVEILRNMHVLHPQLVVDEGAVGIDKTRLGLTYRLNLGTGQHNAGSIALGDNIVERGSAVLYIYVRRFLVHSATAANKNNQ